MKLDGILSSPISQTHELDKLFENNVHCLTLIFSFEFCTWSHIGKMKVFSLFCTYRQVQH